MQIADSFNYSLIWNILSTLTFTLITFGICVYYVIKKQSIDGFLLVSGSFIHVFTNIFYSIVMPIIMRHSGMTMSGNGLLISIANVFSVIGSILFLIGLILLIVNHISLQRRIDG